MKFSPESPFTILSGGWDSSVFVWDTRQREPVGHMFGPSISGESIDIKGSMVLTGSYSNEDQMKIWDLRTMEMITRLDWDNGAPCPTAYVYAAQFSKRSDDMIVAGSSGKNEVKIYDKGIVYRPSQTIAGLEKGVFSVDVSENGSLLAFGCSNGDLFTFNIGQMI